MPWYSFQQVAGVRNRVLDQFGKVYGLLRAPSDLALFCKQEPGEDHVTYYLTPATELSAPLLLRIFNAKPSAAPPADATLLVGVPGKRPAAF